MALPQVLLILMVSFTIVLGLRDPKRQDPSEKDRFLIRSRYDALNSEKEKLYETVSSGDTRLQHDVRYFKKGISTGTSLQDDEKFSQSLFNSPFSVKVRKAVLDTDFFKQIITNTLPPEQYGGYMVQDAAYVYDAVKAFELAATKMQGTSPDFALFYRGRAASYKGYGRTDFENKWKLKSTESIVMGPAAATYVAYEMKLAEDDPKHLSIGILPCAMLWTWVAEQLDSKVPMTNVYRSWVNDNLPQKSSNTTRTFVDKFFTEKDKPACQTIFNEGMINELNFFRSACGQKPVDYSFGKSM